MTLARACIGVSLLIGSLACQSLSELEPVPEPDPPSGLIASSVIAPAMVPSIMVLNISSPTQGELAFDIQVMHTEFAGETVTLRASSPGSGFAERVVTLDKNGSWSGSMRSSCSGTGTLTISLFYGDTQRSMSMMYLVDCH